MEKSHSKKKVGLAAWSKRKFEIRFLTFQHKRFSDLCSGEPQAAPQEDDSNYPTNNKEIAEVFTKLYDQFDKMIT